MSFECKQCEREVSNSEMMGIAIGHVGKAILEKNLGTQAFSKGEFSAGFLNGLKVPCPSCNKCDWKFK